MTGPYAHSCSASGQVLINDYDYLRLRASLEVDDKLTVDGGEDLVIQLAVAGLHITDGHTHAARVAERQVVPPAAAARRAFHQAHVGHR